MSTIAPEPGKPWPCAASLSKWRGNDRLARGLGTGRGFEHRQGPGRRFRVGVPPDGLARDWRRELAFVRRSSRFYVLRTTFYVLGCDSANRQVGRESTLVVQLWVRQQLRWWRAWGLVYRQHSSWPRHPEIAFWNSGGPSVRDPDRGHAFLSRSRYSRIPAGTPRCFRSSHGGAAIGMIWHNRNAAG